SSAEWIEEAPTTGQRLLLPLDNFGTVKFTGATTVEKGKSRTIAQAGGKSVTMYGPTDQPLAKPSALGSNGSSFSVTRTNVVSRPTVP
ncbi:MAG TPA: G1 family glutamic endopeptidase, partial [Thermomicrobiaceae bacterium]|nr:G1 family glutamic endopeptidase [Thermomicrobiaceae bacterium]